MGYVNKRDRDNAIVKVTIAFGKKLGCENDSDAEITLREPTELEVLRWRAAQKEGEVESMEKFKELLNDMMIKHNLMEDENEKMTNEAVSELIFSKTDVTAQVVTEWSNKVFRSPMNSKEGK